MSRIVKFGERAGAEVLDHDAEIRHAALEEAGQRPFLSSLIHRPVPGPAAPCTTWNATKSRKPTAPAETALRANAPREAARNSQA